MINLAIFASGGGSNGEKIHDYFKNNRHIKVNCIVVNQPNAGIIKKAKDWNCAVILIEKQEFYSSNAISTQLKERGVDFIILAGFLWLIPQHLLNAFPQKIVNIHPALLPNYGGKGMYGMKVHKAVFEAKEKESGITIHTIDEEYDKGQILFQKSVNIKNCSSPEEIAAKVLVVEHENYARIIEEYINQ